jgi:hypothetical protein
VSADSANDAWAVGYYNTNGTNPLPTDSLILHWNGSSWKKVPSPSPGGTAGLTSLDGVHAVSANDAWAVGTYTEGTGADANAPLILHWNGTRWTQFPSPSPGGLASTTGLSGVSAVSAKDVWAAGQYSAAPQSVPPIKSLMVHWSGTRWKQAASPSPGGATGFTYLDGVSAVSANDAWATGIYATGPTANVRPVILRWNGTSWKQVPSPNPGGTTGGTYMRAVSADSAKDAWAVGAYSTTCGDCAPQSLILHWNGTSWKKVPSPS